MIERVRDELASAARHRRVLARLTLEDRLRLTLDLLAAGGIVAGESVPANDAE